MRQIKQWLFVNLFLLLLFGGGAAVSFFCGLALDLMRDRTQAAYLSAVASILALLLAYRFGKRLHARLARSR